MGFRAPLLSSIVRDINRQFVKNKSFDYFRGTIDKFSKDNYMDMLEYFKMRKTDSISNYQIMNKYGYSKFMLYKNSNYEINMIEWDKGARSIIHNHPPEGCVIKLIEGSLLEEQFLYKSSTKIKHTKSNIIVPINLFNKTRTHSYYIDGIHRITNINNEKSYPLHLYSPEFVPKIYN